MGSRSFLRGVHRSGWVKLKSFFNSTPPWWVKKIQLNLTNHRDPTQPNPRGSDWVRLDPWVGLFFLITIIIIKLSIRITSPQIRVNI